MDRDSVCVTGEGEREREREAGVEELSVLFCLESTKK
jgi:hypothetical protein